MTRVLLTSGSKAGAEALVGLLKGYAYTDISVASSGAEVRRILLGRKYDTVLINAPLTDEVGDALAVDVVKNYYAEAVMVVKAESAELIASRVEDSGVFVVPKPLQKREFFRAMRLAAAEGVRISALQSENTRLRQKLEELRLIGRVKCLLIEKRGMTEETAHRFIEKTAMDNRISRVEAATEILRETEE